MLRHKTHTLFSSISTLYSISIYHSPINLFFFSLFSSCAMPSSSLSHCVSASFYILNINLLLDFLVIYFSNFLPLLFSPSSPCSHLILSYSFKLCLPLFTGQVAGGGVTVTVPIRFNEVWPVWQENGLTG